MDKQLIKVYIFLIVAFIVISPFIKYKDIWITDIADGISGVIYDKFEDIELGMANCSKITETKQTNIPLSNRKAKILFMLDDNWETQYSFAYKALKQKGYPASIAVIPAKVGQPGYMSFSQLQEVYQNGWDLVNHTYNHEKLTELDKDDQAKEIKRGAAWLNAKCFTRASNIIVYPYGAYNKGTVEILSKSNYRAARSLIPGFETNPGKKTYIAKVQNLTTLTEAERAKDLIDQAIKQNRTIIFLNHRFSDNPVDPSGMIYDQSNFLEIINYMKQLRDKIDVITYSEWLNNKRHN